MASLAYKARLQLLSQSPSHHLLSSAAFLARGLGGEALSELQRRLVHLPLMSSSLSLGWGNKAQAQTDSLASNLQQKCSPADCAYLAIARASWIAPGLRCAPMLLFDLQQSLPLSVSTLLVPLPMER